MGAGQSAGGDLSLPEVWRILEALSADFSAAPLTGAVPLTVTFTNLSTPTQAITQATWAYGDGVISHTLALTHTHIYTQAGVYSVTLSVGDGVITDTLTRTNYITVTGGTAYTTTTRVITYTYDKLYRLTDADYSTGESFEYGYDAVGNRAVQTRTLTATSVITYHYDDANRLDYFYTDGVPTELDWDANPLRCAPGTVAASCLCKARACILGMRPTGWWARRWMAWSAALRMTD